MLVEKWGSENEQLANCSKACIFSWIPLLVLGTSTPTIPPLGLMILSKTVLSLGKLSPRAAVALDAELGPARAGLKLLCLWNE